VATDVGAAVVRVENLEVTVNDDETGLVATVSALDALSVQVNGAGGIAEALTAIEASYDDLSASGLFRMQSGVSPIDGSFTQIAIIGRASLGDAFYEVGDYWHVRSDGSSFATRKANKQFFVDNAGNLLAFFSADGAYFNKARIAELDADNISVKSLDADEVLIDGTLITDLIAANAATAINSAYNANVNITNGSPVSGSGAAVTLASMSLTPVNGTVAILSSGYIGTDAWGDADAFGIIRVELLRAGSVVASQDVFYDEDGTDTPRNGAWSLPYRDTSPGISAITWTVRAYWTPVGGGQWAYGFNTSIFGINYKK
jgi:hypothetical protein